MSRELLVLVGGVPAGRVSRARGGQLRFRYDAGYAGTPLSVSMSTRIPEHSDRVVRPWIEGLLPDNEQVIARWSRQFQVDTSAFSLLGTRIGEDCAGAVQFARPERLEELMVGGGDVEWLGDERLAEHIRGLRRDRTAWLAAGATGRFSLAGAQAKTALLHDAGRWGVPSGAIPTTHIIKPAVADLDDHHVNEHMCLTAARTSGLPAARSGILTVDDQVAICVERYDRQRVGGRTIRVHQEDLCQALSVSPTRKYEADGGPGIRTILELLANALPSSQADEAIGRFLDAVIFNWFIAGTDAHAKNHGLLLHGGEVRMAPLYDLASALPSPELHERKMKMAMKLGRSYLVWPHHNPWPGAARAWGLDAGELRERVLGLGARIPDAFSDAAKELAGQITSGDMPARITDGVADRTRRCLAVLEA